jgi:hypothetical protein
MKRFFKFLIILVASTLAVSFLSPALTPLCAAIDQRCNSVASSLPTIQSLWQSTANSEQLWASSGTVVFPLASEVSARRNPPGIALTPLQKKYLRPAFGSLVDRAQINYQAQLMDRWSNGEREIHFGDVDSAAQTYCDRIYLKESRREKDTAQLALIAHELGHFQQCDRLGGTLNFGSEYFRSYFLAGQRYADNSLEAEARTMEQKFVRSLCRSLNCTTPSGRYYENYKKTRLNVPVKVES